MINVPEHIRNLRRFSAITLADGNEAQLLRMSNNESAVSYFTQYVDELLVASVDINRYPDSHCKGLRTILAKDIGGTLENVIVGNGSEGVLSYVLKALFENGDEILTSEGTFVGIYLLAQSFNIPCIKIPLTEKYSYDIDGMLRAIRPNTKMIYISNPNNPTGSMINEASLIEFLDRVPSDVVVVIDEAYYEYAVVTMPSYVNFNPLNYTNVIRLRTFSKAYGLANIRLGYGYSHSSIIDLLMRVKLTFEPGGFVQAIGILAKQHSNLIEFGVRNAVYSLEEFYRFFDSVGLNYIISYGNFLMIKCLSEKRAMDICVQLLNNNIQVSHLAACGLPTCIRITVSSEENNILFFRTFKKLNLGT